MAESKPYMRCASCGHLGMSHGYYVPGWTAVPCRVPGCRCDAYKAPKAKPASPPPSAGEGSGGAPGGET